MTNAEYVRFRNETGLNEGIGVFIWSTESLEDLEIERDDPRLQFTAKGRPGNSSEARA